ncbi:hypothetical protein M5K25_014839 [Dendrobium thyrsiflorum]|uniref:Uncharacterized protein n=1 Tax=Dendrobium thyrsiflorum TaxID=117978 RepID=A0ABD0UPE5_DENTH
MEIERMKLCTSERNFRHGANEDAKGTITLSRGTKWSQTFTLFTGRRTNGKAAKQSLQGMPLRRKLHQSLGNRHLNYVNIHQQFIHSYTRTQPSSANQQIELQQALFISLLLFYRSPNLFSFRSQIRGPEDVQRLLLVVSRAVAVTTSSSPNSPEEDLSAHIDVSNGSPPILCVGARTNCNFS